MVADYLAEEAPETRKKKSHYSRNIKMVCGVILLLAIVCVGVFFYTLDQMKKEERESYINREVIILEEDN